MVGTHQQGIPHLVDIQEGEAPDPYPQELYRLGQPVGIRNKKPEYYGDEQIGNQYACKGDQQGDKDTLVENLADLFCSSKEISANLPNLRRIVFD